MAKSASGEPGARGECGRLGGDVEEVFKREGVEEVQIVVEDGEAAAVGVGEGEVLWVREGEERDGSGRGGKGARRARRGSCGRWPLCARSDAGG